MRKVFNFLKVEKRLVFAKLIVFLLLVSSSTFSQTTPVPTQFDRFVSKPRIEWAAYASDTFNLPLLNKILLERLQKKQIKASLPFDSRTEQANAVSYVSLDSINKAYFEGEAVNIDSSAFNTTEITQILYIENGCLKSYIPWVTPTLPVYISTGTYIGQRFYFNGAFNYRYNYIAKKRNRLSYLGRTKKGIKLDDPANNLKEMYGRNMLRSIWPYLAQHGTEIYSLESNEKLSPGEIDLSAGYKQPVQVAVYDSVANTTIYKYIVPGDAAVVGKYTDMQLVQDWYYDHKKNRVLSCIREIHVFMLRANETTGEKPVPVFKLIFK